MAGLIKKEVDQEIFTGFSARDSSHALSLPEGATTAPKPPSEPRYGIH
jgi:hypothetical protein